MRDILLTMAQMNCLAGRPESNLREMERFVRDYGSSDIICFPEMCLSGYSTSDPELYALTPDDPLVKKVHELASETGAAIVFGYIERAPDGLYLRQEIADGSDAPKFYRKTHLGFAESKVFLASDSIPVFDVKGVCIGIQLCVESHIPDICQTLRAKGAELVLTPFSTGISGTKRRSVWLSYLPARASDNGMFVAACSATGDNGLGTVFGGGMIVLDPKGQVIDEYYGTDAGALTLEIGGKLPRDGPESMSNISYFDRRRPELYK